MAKLLFSKAIAGGMVFIGAVAPLPAGTALGGELPSPAAGSPNVPGNPIVPVQFRGGANGGGQSPGGATGNPGFVAPSAPGVMPFQPVPQPSVSQTLPRNTAPTFVPVPAYPQGKVNSGNRVTVPPSTATSNIPGTAIPNPPRSFAPPHGSTWSKAPANMNANNRAAVANSGNTLAAQPAVAQHLHRQGQNLQGWSVARSQSFERYHQQNARRLEQFLQYREPAWGQLNEWGRDRVRLARERGEAWNNYRQSVWTYRYDRGVEVRDHLRDSCDHLFTLDWWRLHRGPNFFIGSRSPWWWWNHCAWNSAVAFCGFGWTAPIYYDYGSNVILEGDAYIDGQDAGPATDYAQQAIDLANSQPAPAEPMPPEADNQPAEWQPFGVFALSQEKEGDAIMFLQLAVNRQGQISGAFTNTVAGDTEPISGAIDKNTQKVAWHVGDKSETVFETGVANLAQDVAPVLIHFGTQSTQTWLLVRLASPDLPVAPTNLAPEN